MTEKIQLQVNGRSIEGWLQSSVDRSLESLTGVFTVPVAFAPGQTPLVKRQDEVKVVVGSETVVSGYVLAAEPFYDARTIGLRVSGRDRAGDLVRCSATHKGGQWKAAKLDRIIKDLCEPFKITLKVEADIGAPLADFRLSLGESVLDAISRAARLRGVLVMSDGKGGLVVTRAGRNRAPAEIRRGVNVISMDGIGSDERRHSTYTVYGQAGLAVDFDQARQVKAQAKDKEIGRHLPLVINADGNVTQADLQALVDHTERVRRGHAYGFRYMVSGWTVGGKPWPVNARVPIFDDVAGLYGQEWLICSARMSCDLKRGPVTELVVRPIEAYDTVPLKTKIRHRKADRKGHDNASLERGTD